MMKKIAIVTDSNSGITQKEAKKLGIYVLPMPFVINGIMYYEDINLTQDEFYEKLENDCKISTSQPDISSVLDLWDDVLLEYEEIIYVPMSSELSNSYQTACILAQDYDNKIHVVNNQCISITQKQSVLDAVELVDKKWNACDIKKYLEKEKFESSIYIALDTLKYLKNGGRITPSAAAIATILNIKPVLQIQGEKLDSYKKVRGMKQAYNIMINAIKNDFENKFIGHSSHKDMNLYVVYTNNEDMMKEFLKQVKNNFSKYDIGIEKLPLSVACHIGPNAIAIACYKKLKTK